MKPLAVLSAIALGLLSIAAGHRSFVSFDQEKLIDTQRSVVDWQFGNPHSHIVVPSTWVT